MAIPEKLLAGLGKLEPMPVTAQKLTAALKDPDLSATDLARIVELDQAIASMVIKLSNSALFAGRYPIESVREAVVRLGTANLLTAVLDGHVRKMAGAAPLYDLRENELWVHGAVASYAAAEIVKLRPAANIPRVAPVGALLHDLGKLVMSRFMQADWHALVARAKERACSFVEAEREVLGCDHAQVGAALARQWQFPEEIVQAIEFHHHGPPTPSLVVDTVMMANLVAKSVGTGLGAEGMNFDVDPGIRKRLGIEFTAFCRLCASASVRLVELRAEYQLKV